MGVRKLVGGVVCVLVLSALPVRAADDVVVYWNGVTGQTAAVPPGRPGPTSVLDFAMVHAAMHDAIQAIQGRYHTYSGLLAPSEGSEIAAAAQAAHDVLVNRFPAQQAALDLILLNYLGACDDACQAGVTVGQNAADAVIAMRANDGSHPSPPPPPFLGGTAPGEWRPTGPGGMVAEWLSSMRPFTLTDAAQFQPKAPPSLNSQEYTRDYNEVKTLGRATGSSRTPTQTATADFFREGPPGYWNRTLPDIVQAHVPDLGDRARLYALVQISMADALITSWQSKRLFNFWRPITAIREGDTDGNPTTAGEAGWTPHTGTPNYPDYTSGANNLNGAVTGTLRLFFGTNHMEFVLKGAGGVNRDYTKFADVAADVVEARILEGIHFRFADTVARTQGRNVAKWVFKHTLRPVGAEDADVEEEDEEDDQ
jgi:hypothetical protein